MFSTGGCKAHDPLAAAQRRAGGRRSSKASAAFTRTAVSTCPAVQTDLLTPVWETFLLPAAHSCRQTEQDQRALTERRRKRGLEWSVSAATMPDNAREWGCKQCSWSGAAAASLPPFPFSPLGLHSPLTDVSDPQLQTGGPTQHLCARRAPLRVPLMVTAGTKPSGKPGAGAAPAFG